MNRGRGRGGSSRGGFGRGGRGRGRGSRGGGRGALSQASEPRYQQQQQQQYQRQQSDRNDMGRNNYTNTDDDEYSYSGPGSRGGRGRGFRARGYRGGRGVNRAGGSARGGGRGTGFSYPHSSSSYRGNTSRGRGGSDRGSGFRGGRGSGFRGGARSGGGAPYAGSFVATDPGPAPKSSAIGAADAWASRVVLMGRSFILERRGRRGRGGGGRGRGGGAGRRTFFAPYFSDTFVSKGLATGELKLGTIAMSRTSAFVTVPGESADIVIEGRRARNRALNGDQVVVKLFPPSGRRALDSDDDSTDDSEDDDDDELSGNDDDDDAAALTKRTGSGPYQPSGRVVAIWPASRRRPIDMVGRIQGPQTAYQGPVAMLIPTDLKLPKLLIPFSSLPHAFAFNPTMFEDKLVHCRFVAWPVQSQWPVGRFIRVLGDVLNVEDESRGILLSHGISDAPFPRRCYDSLPFDLPVGPDSDGNASDNEDNEDDDAEEQDDDRHQTSDEDEDDDDDDNNNNKNNNSGQRRGARSKRGGRKQFKKRDDGATPVISDPMDVEWTVPADELSRRRDLRSARVFTVDPASARDLDDAVHIRALDNGLWEVGVHIADVSYFVKLHTPLDAVARKRATSTYLMERAVPMLLPVLTANVCSLLPGVDRLAFSVIWTVDGGGHVKHEWIGRTVIRSCAKLSYGVAQAVLDNAVARDCASFADALAQGPVSRSELEQLSPALGPHGGHSVDAVAADLRSLSEIAQRLRAQRIASGALDLNSVKLGFEFDPETGAPIAVRAQESRPANQLIEELMLLANRRVATRIARALPRSALLRQHDSPQPKPLEKFKRFVEAAGFSVDLSSGAALSSSLAAIRAKVPDRVYRALSDQTLRSMQLAKYFCAGDHDRWHHYALAVDLYTHFTSPIRRYADIVVHRQLSAALLIEQGVPPPPSLGAAGQDDDDDDSDDGRPARSRKPANYSADQEAVFSQCVGQAKIHLVASQCNDRKYAARQAGDESAQLYLALYVRDSPVVTTGTVLELGDRFLLVHLGAFGMSERIYYADQPDLLEAVFHDSHGNTTSSLDRGTGATSASDEESDNELDGGKDGRRHAGRRRRQRRGGRRPADDDEPRDITQFFSPNSFVMLKWGSLGDGTNNSSPVNEQQIHVFSPLPVRLAQREESSRPALTISILHPASPDVAKCDHSLPNTSEFRKDFD